MGYVFLRINRQHVTPLHGNTRKTDLATEARTSLCVRRAQISSGFLLLEWLDQETLRMFLVVRVLCTRKLSTTPIFFAQDVFLKWDYFHCKLWLNLWHIDKQSIWMHIWLIQIEYSQFEYTNMHFKILTISS